MSKTITEVLKEKVLNDIEKISLEKLANDLTTVNALKKVFLVNVYYSGTLRKGEDPDPLSNFILQLLGFNKYNGEDYSMTLSNEKIGEIVRSKTDSIFLVEKGFTELESFKTKVENNKNKTGNPGK
jgi:hypothetical protein